MADRNEIYRRQAAAAAKEIATWPKWMQRNLTPPRAPAIAKKPSKTSSQKT